MKIGKKTLVSAGVGVALYKYLDKYYDLGHDIATFMKVGRLIGTLEMLPAKFTVADSWERTVKTYSEKICLISAETGESYTFKRVDELANAVAYYVREVLMVPEGGVVSIFMENRPELVWILLGLSKAGVVAALINTNNVKKPLLHSIKISKCETLIFGTELENSIAEIRQEIPDIKLVSCNDGKIISNLDALRLEQAWETPRPNAPSSYRENTGKDSAFAYIYTSGTTGLPKACLITNFKYISMGHGLNMFGVSSNDVGYCCLPLYHTSGVALGLGNTVQRGCTFVLARKFSARNFLKHCGKYHVTFTQYIGEMCRYMLNSPPTEYDKKHTLRIAIGNGLRREIWQPFQKRFGIPEIGEFYGATEGNVAFANHCQNVLKGDTSMVGSVGRYGPMLRKMIGFKIVKFDVVSEQPIRDPKTGFCIECGPDEPGELLGLIDNSRKTTEFKGYTTGKDTEKKILRNVLKQGDSFFRTGDLMKMDSNGRLFFVDRIGDTFRWKGENVSTGEVGEVVSVFPGIHEANIYGVSVPGNEDGRAPMAALVLEPGTKLNLPAFLDSMKRNLASYAVPRFVRILPAMDVTGTFKHRKVDFVTEGIDVTRIQDPVYFLDLEKDSYETLDASTYAKITQPRARL